MTREKKSSKKYTRSGSSNRHRAILIVKTLAKDASLTAVQSLSKENPFRVLISTILSHRTKDEKTEIAGKKLLTKYPTPKTLVKAPLRSIANLIREVGFYRTKAKYIKKASEMLLHQFYGKVPDTYEKLLTLPGVGPKTAGCVLVYGFGKPAIPVDTHVHRISNRLGIVRTKDPEETEKALINLLPKKYWLPLNQAFVEHGKHICKPISPHCTLCPVSHLCEHNSSVSVDRKQTKYIMLPSNSEKEKIYKSRLSKR